MGFDPCNRSLKIQKSKVGAQIPKVGAHLVVWGFIPHTLPHPREHEM